MAVMTATQKKSEGKDQEMVAKKHFKSRDKTRPITATLDHPLILDIKLLKRLDMTTFTKKGLIALSKFCGISLINKTDSKRKLNKCVKTIQYLKKQTGSDSAGMLPNVETNKKDHIRPKRKPGKQISRGKPRIRFKIPDEGNSQEEDSSDVVCRRHETKSKSNKQTLKPATDGRLIERRAIVDDILNNSIENIIPEPCKTCSRFEHPERFHSHPKMSLKLTERNLEERFKNVLTTKESEGGGRSSDKRKSAKDNESESPQESDKTHQGSSTVQKIHSQKSIVNNSSTRLQTPEEGGKPKGKGSKKPSMPSWGGSKSSDDSSYLKRTTVEKEGCTASPVEEAMKFVTGCYICGMQVSAKSRIKHEETCIAEWRNQNSLLSPNERKPEPKRPDFRFTALGEVDCQGTFDSIWANHKDSLVPCKKCGRKFFPDRIERHENCCNNIPISVKYKQ